MGDDKVISLSLRAAALDIMREPFREQAKRNIALYQELCGETPDDALENGINALWLQSVTDGSESYKTYLVSPLWNAISRDIFLRDGHRCGVCRREAEVVHHRSYDYEAMAGLDDSPLISLCSPCHHYIHFDQLEKTPKAAWDKRLRALQKSFVRKRKTQHNNSASHTT